MLNIAGNTTRVALPGRTPPEDIRYRWLPALLLLLFLSASLLTDLWPAKNVYFLIFHKVDGLLTMELPLTPAMRYAAGHSENSADALPYVALVKLVHLLIPGRLLCLRVVSIASTLAALYFLYRLGALLFSRTIGTIFLFLLVTSPAYLESMRSIGFIPLTNAVVAAGCYFLALVLQKNRRRSVTVFLLALCCFLTFSLYALGRLVLVLAVAVLAFYAKSNWRRLLLLLVCLAVLILGSDLVFGDLRFDCRDWYQVGGEWLMASSETVPDFWKDLTADLELNARNLFHALFQVGRTHFKEPTFEEEVGTSRLFNPVYTVFFFLGLFFCLKKPRRSEILLLAWFGLFFILPIFSSDVSERRMVFALNPLYLLIAVGLGKGYADIRSRMRSQKVQSTLSRAGVVFLLIIGAIDLHQFFFRVAAPVCGYSSTQLREIAEFIEERGREVSSICLRTVPGQQAMIWGNPWFDPRFVDEDILHKFIYDFSEVPDLKEHLQLARSEGIGVLFLYPFPPGISELTPEQARLQSQIRALSESPPPETKFFTLAGGKVHSMLVEEEDFQIPPAANRSYRWAQYPPARSVFVSSEYSWDNSNIHLVDGNPGRFWRVSHARLGEPAWVIVDFGKGVKKRINTLTALPRRDRPEEFFRRAELLGSNDGVNWEFVAPIVQEEVPPKGEWRKWSFANDRAYRSYKLIIYDGHAGRARNFLSLAGLTLQEVR